MSSFHIMANIRKITIRSQLSIPYFFHVPSIRSTLFRIFQYSYLHSLLVAPSSLDFEVTWKRGTVAQKGPRGKENKSILKRFGHGFYYASCITLHVDMISHKVVTSREHTTIPRAFKMLSLHIGQVQCSLSQGSTHDLWKTCLENNRELHHKLHIEALQGQNGKNQIFFSALGNFQHPRDKQWST